MKTHEITAALVREFLNYDPDTGALCWKPRNAKHFASDGDHKRWNTKYAGKPAFRAKAAKGYLGGKMFGTKHVAHRIAWLHYYGEWPKQQIDHLDHNKTNNCIANLRDVNTSQNARNRRKNGDRVSGVRYQPKTQNWRATLRTQRNFVHLGCFATKDEAISARKDAEWAYGYHENHDS